MSLHRSGPVRSEAARRSILEATARLFVERGYERLTIEGIAAEAGVGKQTIYRWWRAKSAIVSECLLEGLLLSHRLVPPDTGDVHRDLVDWMGEIFRLMAEPSGEVLVRSLIAAATEDAQIGRKLRDTLGSSVITDRLRAGVGSASNLYEGAPFEEIAEALVGSAIVRALSREPGDRAAAEALVTASIGRPAAF